MNLDFLAERPCSGLQVEKLVVPMRGGLLDGTGFSRDFAAAQVHEICAPNGSGKSTLLRIMAGLEGPQEGYILITRGQSPQEFLVPESISAELISWLPPEDDYPMPCLVGDVVTAGRWRFHQGRPTQTDREIAVAVMDILGISGLANRNIVTLSSGQKRRTSFARTLVQDADVLLLDEPFNGLDVPSTETIRRCLDETAARGRTVICAHPGQPVWITCA